MARSSTTWKKGQIPNPHGRPRSYPEFIDEMRRHAPLFRERLVAAAEKGESWAVALGLAYAYGRPSETTKEASKALTEVPHELFWTEAERRLHATKATANGAGAAEPEAQTH